MNKQDIKERLKELNLHDVYGYRMEIKALPQVLGLDEELYGITSGLYHGRRWLSAVTGETVYMISSSPVSSTEVKKFARNSVHNISSRKGLFFGKIIIELADDDIIILEHVAKKSIDGFLWAVDR